MPKTRLPGQVIRSGSVPTTALSGGVVSSSIQVTTLLPSDTVSSSIASSPSQGTVRVTVNGVVTDVDTGLQTGDSPTFTNITATGTVTAREFYTQVVSSSIIYQSGSTKFGDTVDDVMSVTGSIGANGNFIISSSGTVSIGTTEAENSVGVYLYPTGEIRIKDNTENGTSQISIVNNNTSPDSEQFFVAMNLGEIDLGNRRDGALKLFTSGSERLRIGGNGNVGIGTTNPTAKLHVSGGFFRVDNTLGYGATYNNTSATGMYITFSDTINSSAIGTNNNNLIFYNNTNTTERMRIDTDGNLLVGVTSSIDNTFRAVFYGTSKGGIILQNATNYGAVVQNGNDFLIDVGRGGTAGNFIIRNGSSLTERMRIDSTGNVGIGTTSPAYRFDVVSTGSAVTGRVRSTFSNAYFIIDRQDTSSESYLRFATAGSNIWSLGIRDNNNILYFNNGSDRVTINSSGYVAIGATAFTARLTVTDALSNSGWATNSSTGLAAVYINNPTTTSGAASVVEITHDTHASVRLASYRTDATNYWQSNFAIAVRGADTNMLTAMTVNYAGNVGIGTTSPATLLDVRSVNSSGATGATIRIGSQNHGGSGDEFANLEFYWGDPDAAEVKTKIYAKNVGNVGPGGGGAADLLFATRPSGGSLTERVRITAIGDVAIGTSFPKTYSGFRTLTIGASSINGGVLAFASTYNSGDGAEIYQNSSGTLFFNINSTLTAATINSSGNVGIGTTAPYSQLHLTETVTMGLAGNARPAFKVTNWGYSTSYRALLIGSPSTTYGHQNTGSVTIAFNYDPSINANGAFNGDGREIIFRNGTQFVTPNSANTSFNLYNLVLVDGNVGIGTASPTTKLQVVGAISSSGDISVNANTYVNLTPDQRSYIRGAGTNNYDLFIQAHQNIRFGTNHLNFGETTKVIIDPTGNVGIGTSNPSSKLHVSSSIGNGGPMLKLEAVSSNGVFDWFSSAYASNMTAGNNVIHIFGKESATKNSGYIGFNYQGNGSDSNFLTFGLYNVNNVFNITGAGNVGIGTTSPTCKLDIREGNILVERDGSAGSPGSWPVAHGLNVSSWAADGPSTDTAIALINAAAGRVSSSDTYANNAYLLRLAADDGVTGWFKASGNAYIKGDLGIGTTTPSFKLHVQVPSGANRDILIAGVEGVSNGLFVSWNHSSSKTHVKIADIPTSSVGLPSGTLYSDGGTIKIA